MSAIQKSLELVIKGQTSNQSTNPPSAPPVGDSSASQPATSLDGERVGIWTTRVKSVNSLVSLNRVTRLLTLALKHSVQVMG